MKSAKLNLSIGLPVYAAAILFSLTLVLFSCQKNVQPAPATVSDEEASTVAQENVSADAAYEDLSEVGFSADADLQVAAGSELGGTANGAGIGAGLQVYENLSRKIGPCTTITVTPNDTTYPKTVVLNYGDGCACKDGKFRKGMITLFYTKPLRKPGAVLTITLTNFYLNRAHIEGTKVIMNTSQGDTHQFSVIVTGGKVTFPNGRGFKYEKTKTVTQIAGMDTKTVSDDVYSIVGRAKTTYNNGTTVVLDTETPLIKAVACDWIESGVLKIKINDRVLYLDFGNGDCDNKATLKWGDHVIDITLP